MAEVGKKLGQQALADGATLVKPTTILAWHRQQVAQQCDGSQQRQAPDRPTIDGEFETLLVRLARGHRSWDDDRMVGALANVGYTVSDQTVGTILQRHGIPLAPERTMSPT